MRGKSKALKKESAFKALVSLKAVSCKRRKDKKDIARTGPNLRATENLHFIVLFQDISDNREPHDFERFVKKLVPPRFRPAAAPICG